MQTETLPEFRRHPAEILDLQLAFAAVEAQARTLASLNRQLTARPTSGQDVDVSLMLHEICATFARSGNAIHSVVHRSTGSHRVTPAVNMAVGQIVAEAVMNSIKYAYPEDQVR